ncbi:MAG: hypothetical protein ACM3KR_01115 [Deltaproteobacteria bacterium]
MINIATEYLAWCIFGITKIVPIILLTTIIYKLIMDKREQQIQRYTRVTYSKGRAYDQDAGQNFNAIA